MPVRQATAQYHDVAAAEAAGYQNTHHCVPGMGIHFVNVALLDDTVQETQPEVLVYAPTADGLELVAVEYIAATEDRPELFGHAFDDGPFPGTYALHAWVWAHNPDGMFAAHNPEVTCPGGDDGGHDH